MVSTVGIIFLQRSRRMRGQWGIYEKSNLFHRFPRPRLRHFRWISYQQHPLRLPIGGEGQRAAHGVRREQGGAHPHPTQPFRVGGEQDRAPDEGHALSRHQVLRAVAFFVGVRVHIRHRQAEKDHDWGFEKPRAGAGKLGFDSFGGKAIRAQVAAEIFTHCVGEMGFCGGGGEDGKAPGLAIVRGRGKRPGFEDAFDERVGHRIRQKAAYRPPGSDQLMEISRRGKRHRV